VLTNDLPLALRPQPRARAEQWGARAERRGARRRNLLRPSTPRPAARLPRGGRHTVAAGAVTVLLALGLAACSSSGTPSTTTTTAAPVTTTLPPLATSTAEIKHAYAVLFDLANPAVTPKLAVVQDGAALKAAFIAALKSPLAKSAAGATVSKVTIQHGVSCKNEFLPSPCALVTYTIFGPTHSVLLTSTGGLAIYQNPQWLVAKVTICTLLALENGGATPPGCSG